MNRITVARTVLDEARTFFEECGADGHEGTAMIMQCGTGVADRLVVPKQLAGDSGGWVEVPMEGKLQLATALGPEDRYVARIHSHPCEAFHSQADDENPALTHEGALSIVVPFFGLGLRRGLDATAIFVLLGERWIELPPGRSRDRWIVTA